VAFPRSRGDEAGGRFFRVPCSFQGRRVYVVLDEMRTVPVDRLGRQLGALDGESVAVVQAGLRELFGD